MRLSLDVLVRQRGLPVQWQLVDGGQRITAAGCRLFENEPNCARSHELKRLLSWLSVCVVIVWLCVRFRPGLNSFFVSLSGSLCVCSESGLLRRSATVEPFFFCLLTHSLRMRLSPTANDTTAAVNVACRRVTRFCKVERQINGTVKMQFCNR